LASTTCANTTSEFRSVMILPKMGFYPGIDYSPGFPVQLGGSGALHAAFLKESRIRGYVQRSV
jgi:hypothetical protein